MTSPQRAPRSLHRTGRRYRTAKALMHQHYGYVCHWCGHGGAGEADHLDPISLHPDQPIDWRRMRPIHGSNYPCRVCLGATGKPRCCNQERGNKPLSRLFKPAITW